VGEVGPIETGEPLQGFRREAGQLLAFPPELDPRGVALPSEAFTELH
jgi:hypothetical protein